MGNLRRHKDMVANDWEELDLMVMCVVRVHLVDNASFTFYDNGFIEKLRTKLCNTYEKVIASNKVCLMRRLHDLCTKHSNIYASHLNNFDALWSQLQAQKMTMDDELKCVFLLCTLPSSWDTFCTLLGLVHQMGNWSIMTLFNTIG